MCLGTLDALDAESSVVGACNERKTAGYHLDAPQVSRMHNLCTRHIADSRSSPTLKTRTGDGSTHWSVRMLVQCLRISRTTVRRVWQWPDL